MKNEKRGINKEYARALFTSPLFGGSDPVTMTAGEKLRRAWTAARTSLWWLGLLFHRGRR